MTTFEAEIDQTTKEVHRVIVSPHEGWAAANLGGVWEISAGDETVTTHIPGRVYAGIGAHFDPGVPEAFVVDVWDSVKATTPNRDGEYHYRTEGMLTWHQDRAWRNLLPDGSPNTWEPPTQWREYPLGDEHPLWAQPSGAADAYPDGFIVEHDGKAWSSNVAANVWEPGATGITQWDEVT